MTKPRDLAKLGGGFIQSGTGAIQRTVESKLKDTVSVKDFGAVGDGVADDTTALNVAATAAAAQKKALFVPAGIYKMTAPWVVPIEVYVLGESPSIQPGYDPGNYWQYGSIIYKAHTGDCVTKIGTIPYQSGAPIENITISSNRFTYPGGNGFVIDKAAGVHMIRCNAFGVGGDSFVVGVTPGIFTGNNLMHNCYSNNPSGANYRITQGYSRINDCLSDGGTYGIRLSGCPLVVINNFHFEGFTSAGIYIEDGCTNLKFNSGLLVNSASALYGVQIEPGGGSGNMFNNIDIGGGANVAGSVGVSMPVFSVDNHINNCVIGNWAIGVDNNADYGTDHTWIVDNVFSQNDLAIRSNGENTIYRGNTFSSTIGTWDINHIYGTKGLWSGNTFGRGANGINPVATGVQGNFSGIRVKDNTGFVTRNRGTTGSIAAYTNIAHGLAGIPAYQLVLTSNTPFITSFPQIASLDATNFSLYWNGATNVQWNWEAALPCDY